MKITRFDKFINESHTEDDETFTYIFIDLIDEGFEMNCEKVYFNPNDMSYTKQPNQKSNKPGYFISLVKGFTDNDSVDFELIKSLIQILEDCNSKISSHGIYTIDDISFSTSHFNIEYRLIDDKSNDAEVNTSDGFDEFISKINSKWNQSFNKVTRAFELTVTKDGILLSPVNSEVNVKSMISPVKSFISNCVTRKYFIGGRPNWDYKYDIKPIDGKILIKFENRIDTSPRRYPEEE